MRNFLIILLMAGVNNLFGQSELGSDSIVNSLRAKFKLSEYDRTDHIMQFNKDTFLVAGYLGDNTNYNAPTNVVFQTADAGKTWIKYHFKGNAWIYNTHYQTDGKVWMGGSDEWVHYSSDYGRTWTRNPKPFIPVNRVLSIYMTDSLNGIAGGLHNGLAITNDNWKTSKQIPSPLDQKKFSITKNSSRNRIDKVRLIDSMILINQNEHIYYSKLNPVDWKTFNIPTRNFSIDQQRHTIALFSSGDKVYLLDAKLNLIETYVEPGDPLPDLALQNQKVDITSFLDPGIQSTQIKGVKFDFDKMSGGCMPFALYKENVKDLKVSNAASFDALKNILETCDAYKKPLAPSFQFSAEDLDDYFNYYNKVKTKRQEEKVWGGDFSNLLNIENSLFLDPKRTVDSLSQQLLDSVYKTIASYPYLVPGSDPYIIVNVINNNSDRLIIASKSPALFSLPWTIEYKGRSFETYDTRITELLKQTLPKEFNYYNKLFAGELIYSLIEQRIINEMVYQKGN
jgi:hypothetical protein